MERCAQIFGFANAARASFSVSNSERTSMLRRIGRRRSEVDRASELECFRKVKFSANAPRGCFEVIGFIGPKTAGDAVPEM